jgi:hypothetical protein
MVTTLWTLRTSVYLVELLNMEHFVESRHLNPITVRCKLTNSVAPEPEGSSPHPQQPATVPYPQPGESTPQPPTNLPKVHFDPILPSMPWSSKWSEVNCGSKLLHLTAKQTSYISPFCINTGRGQCFERQPHENMTREWQHYLSSNLGGWLLENTNCNGHVYAVQTNHNSWLLQSPVTSSTLHFCYVDSEQETRTFLGKGGIVYYSDTVLNPQDSTAKKMFISKKDIYYGNVKV